jgi:D-serine deaminase-like pyridoxal phosphate-dependent protein
VTDPAATTLETLATPALVVDRGAFDHNVATMGAAWPGARLRPHVKAFKSTAMAQALADAGHPGFCCATTREIEGMAGAGLCTDLLLANESVDPNRLARLGRLVRDDAARVTVAVDSDETVDAAARAGLLEVLIDVNVGLPRCGCAVDDAGRLADRARAAGLEVRGVMGYEGHIVGLADRAERDAGVAAAMAMLLDAHEAVGGDVISGGGTGTWDSNTWITELQAGSFTLMDTAYATLGLPFRPGLSVLGTVISVNPKDGFAVADVGLKALGMDHGKPEVDGAFVWFCSDEHLTFGPPRGTSFAEWDVHVGDRTSVWPAHIDPTISQHERMHVVDGSSGAGAARVAPARDAAIVDVWPVDLRNW